MSRGSDHSPWLCYGKDMPPVPMDSHFGQALRLLLAESGKTQRELARHLDMVPQTISAKVNGTIAIRAAELGPIAEFLGRDAVEIVLLAQRLAGASEELSPKDEVKALREEFVQLRERYEDLFSAIKIELASLRLLANRQAVQSREVDTLQEPSATNDG